MATTTLYTTTPVYTGNKRVFSTMATFPTAGFGTGCFSHCGGDGGEQPSPTRRQMAATQGEYYDDAALAKEMNKLSVNERERILEEIHGVAKEREETPDFLATCLQQMDTCLANLPQSKRRDLDRALFLNPRLESDTDFKLMFLRAENYNAQMAAVRVAKYFTFKRDLFGDDKLVQTITLEDLDENDLEIAQAGSTALLISSPDQSGRPVMFSDSTRTPSGDVRKLLRFTFYQFMGILEKNETAQKKGVVVVLFAPSNEVHYDFANGMFDDRPPTPSEVLNTIRQCACLLSCVPVRFTSCHFCFDNHLRKFIIALLGAGMGKEFRLRLRTHFGSATEIRYSLRSFGILADGMILSDLEEDEKPKMWQRYLEMRRQAEVLQVEQMAAEETKTGIVPSPNPHDVLLGRGRSYQEFPGNIYFRELLDSVVTKYKSCNHLFEKTIVLKKLIQNIHDTGGRFLRRLNGKGWEIVDDEMAKDKMRKYFRTKPAGNVLLAAKTTEPDNAISNRQAKRLKLTPSPSAMDDNDDNHNMEL